MVLNFGGLDSELFKEASVNGKGLGATENAKLLNNDEFSGEVPIGAILPWAKTLGGTPDLTDNYVQCSGQVIADNESPLNGQTIPDLNGDNRFLRGETSSGGTGGSETHNHGDQIAGASPGVTAGDNDMTSTLPTYYEVVWIMRIK